MIAGARQCRERGQGAQRDIHAERAGAVAPARDAFEEFRRQRIRRHQPRVQQFWIDAGGDIFGADGLAIVEDDADSAAVLDDHLAHAGIEFDLGAMPARGARHRLRDRAHAADGVAPDALLAVHLAKRMVQHHVGRARGIGAGVIADDGVEAEQRLHQVVFKALVQHFAGRAGEQIEQAALLLQRKLRRMLPVPSALKASRIALAPKPSTMFGGARSTNWRSTSAIASSSRENASIAAGVAFAQPCNGLARAAFAGQQIAAVGRGQKFCARRSTMRRP